MSDVRQWLPRQRQRKRLLILSACVSVAVYLTYWNNRSVQSSGIEGIQNIFTPQASILPPRTSSTPQERSKHNYRSDGILEVNPDGKHPIFELVKRAEAAWESKALRASETLDEAVEEYTKRYHRLPPAGFDDWWDYVQEHNVKLPDEYDSIYEQLEPFWGVDPVDLRKIQSDWEVKESAYTLTVGKVDKTPIRVLRNGLPPDKKDTPEAIIMEQMAVLKDVEHMLPAFRAIIAPWDNPSLLKDWELDSMAREAAAARTFIDVNKPLEHREGWIYACPPNSPARRDPPDHLATLPSVLPPPSKKTFIHDHRLAMDPCLHPSHLRLVGQYISHGKGPYTQRTLVPKFANCATPLHHDLLPIPPQGSDENGQYAEWDEKIDDRLLWRGTNTGMYHTASTHWRQSQRSRLVMTATNLTGTIDVLASPKEGAENQRVGKGVTWRKSRANPAIFDIAFAGKPNSCEPSTCDHVQNFFEWRRKMSVSESKLYKYVVDVDGNGWSSRFKRLMASNSVVFKSTTYPEWYTDRIQPWLHYVPISVEYSDDLYDALVFFRGDLNGEGDHDAMAKKIAAAAKDWTDRFWRKEDMTAYMFRMILEYARVMSIDRDAMTYKGVY